MISWVELMRIIDPFLLVIGLGPQLIIAQIASLLLSLNLFFLISLISLSLLSRSKRAWLRRNDRTQGPYFEKIIEDYLQDSTSQDRKPSLQKMIDAMKGEMYFGFLRRLIQRRMTEVQSQQFVALVELYKSGGFMDRDLKELHSKFWWRRLAAAVRLERLHDSSLAEHFQKILYDKSEIVSLVAIRAYSKIGKDTEQLLKAMSRRAPARKDIFMEILISIGSQDPAKLIDFLASCYDPYIAALCIKALGHLKESSAMSSLLILTTSSSDEVVLASAEALGKIGDRRAMTALRGLLYHPRNPIRAIALQSLIALEEQSFEDLERELKEDSAIEIRRVLFDSRFKINSRGRAI